VNDIEMLGALDAIEKVASAAFGGLSALAPATSSILGNTAKVTTSQIRATGRATKIKPPAHKPMKVATPSPAQPSVEPTTFTPTQMPKPKTAALDKKNEMIKKLKLRAAQAKPENEPVVHTNGKPRDF
jgi:hypothetical protein